MLDKKNEEYLHFKFNGIEEFKWRNVYIVGIVQKDVDIGKTSSHNWRWIMKYKGVALIDAETMEIVQLYRECIDTYQRITFFVSRKRFFTQIEYDMVRIMDQFLTVPVAKTVELYRMDGTLDTIYKYKYGNYRAFAVDTKIKYETID